MLKHFWLWLGRLLGKMLLLLVVIGLIGWATGTAYYGWKFSGPVASEEQIPADEASFTQAIIEDAVRVVEQHRDNTRVLRDAHADAGKLPLLLGRRRRGKCRTRRQHQRQCNQQRAHQ